MQRLLSKLSADPRRIFLIDACGALLSACLLCFLLIPFYKNIGLPKQTLLNLAIIAAVFCAYSTACHFLSGTRWKVMLAVICIANVLYALLTVCTLLIHQETISVLAVLYFTGEIFIIFTLCYIELQLIRTNKHQ